MATSKDESFAWGDQRTGSNPSGTLTQKLEWLLEDLKALRPERVLLFGSAARCDMDAFSDLDIVMIQRTAVPFLQRGIEAMKHLRSALMPVDLFVYTPEEFRRMVEAGNPFIEQVLKEGKVLYEETA